jgi:hypothetical protein
MTTKQAVKTYIGKLYDIKRLISDLESYIPAEVQSEQWPNGSSSATTWSGI